MAHGTRFCAGFITLLGLVSGPSAQAVELYLKTGLAHGEAAWLFGLHENTVIDDDAYRVLDIGLRGKPADDLRVKYDFKTKTYDRYHAANGEAHRLKLYWTPRAAMELYLDVDYAERDGRFYLLTHYLKPRWVSAARGGTLKIGPTYRHRDFHVYDNFDSTAFGMEASYAKAGHFLKFSALAQDASNDLYDRRTLKTSWKIPLADRGRDRFKAYVELRHRDYFAVSQADKTARATRLKLRGEWSRRFGTGWKWRTRLQQSWRDSNLAATSYDDLYGEVMLVYQGHTPSLEENENN